MFPQVSAEIPEPQPGHQPGFDVGTARVGVEPRDTSPVPPAGVVALADYVADAQAVDLDIVKAVRGRADDEFHGQSSSPASWSFLSSSRYSRR